MALPLTYSRTLAAPVMRLILTTAPYRSVVTVRTTGTWGLAVNPLAATVPSDLWAEPTRPRDELRFVVTDSGGRYAIVPVHVPLLLKKPL